MHYLHKAFCLVYNYGMALINILTKGNLSTHLSRYTYIHNTCSIVWLIISAIPSIQRWEADTKGHTEVFRLAINSFQKLP